LCIGALVTGLAPVMPGFGRKRGRMEELR
jgi:hypothetical protein